MLATQPSEFDAVLGAMPSSNVNDGNSNEGVNRNTSVRSVMTLPAYNPKPYDTEQVLGREGERGGIDTVLEYPETNEEEEARREEEMEALYQVRLARRNEVAERNERRRLRAAAREANDHVTLRRLREQEQERERIRAEGNAANAIEQLRAEAERAKAKPRAVSSVSYGDLGVARHDGTRLRISMDHQGRPRANSSESERQGLLGDAASMAESIRLPQHGRNNSSGSLASVDSLNSNEFPRPHLTRSRSNSRPETPLRINTTFNNSNTSIQEVDLGLERINLDENRDLNARVDSPPPPGYENVDLGSPPGYTSPIFTRNSRISFPGADEDTAYHSAMPSQETNSGAGTTVRHSNPASTIATRLESATPESASSRRGVGGIPQLPSLRLSNLPSIVVDEASARTPRPDGFDHSG